MDGTDLLLVGIGLCAVVIYAAALIINVNLLARIPGIFANDYFEAENFLQSKNISVSSLSNDGCPLGIDLNENNQQRFAK